MTTKDFTKITAYILSQPNCSVNCKGHFVATDAHETTNRMIEIGDNEQTKRIVYHIGVAIHYGNTANIGEKFLSKIKEK